MEQLQLFKAYQRYATLLEHQAATRLDLVAEMYELICDLRTVFTSPSGSAEERTIKYDACDLDEVDGILMRVEDNLAILFPDQFPSHPANDGTPHAQMFFVHENELR